MGLCSFCYASFVDSCIPSFMSNFGPSCKQCNYVSRCCRNLRRPQGLAAASLFIDCIDRSSRVYFNEIAQRLPSKVRFSFLTTRRSYRTGRARPRLVAARRVKNVSCLRNHIEVYIPTESGIQHAVVCPGKIEGASVIVVQCCLVEFHLDIFPSAA